MLEDIGVGCTQLLVAPDVPLCQPLCQDLQPLHADQAPALQAPP